MARLLIAEGALPAMGGLKKLLLGGEALPLNVGGSRWLMRRSCDWQSTLTRHRCSSTSHADKKHMPMLPEHLKMLDLKGHEVLLENERRSSESHVASVREDIPWFPDFWFDGFPALQFCKEEKAAWAYLKSGALSLKFKNDGRTKGWVKLLPENFATNYDL